VIRLEPRATISWSRSLLVPVWAGAPAGEALWLIASSAFGNEFGLTETLARAIPLMFTGLAAAVAFRAKFYNIGAEGQLYCGALAATALGTGLIDLPPIPMIATLFVAGSVAGAIAVLLPAWLKTSLNVDEVVTTLLLNFVILLLVSFAVEGPMKDPMSLGWPQTAPIVDNGLLPALIERSRLHAGLVLAMLLACIIALLWRYSRFGYNVRVLGANPDAARHAGISPKNTLLCIALFSGAIAGCAGVSEVAGLKGYLTLDLSPGFGYTGIAVAMLAGLNPIGVIVAAVFVAGLFVGADSMGRSLAVPSYIADIMVASAVLSVLVGLLLTRYRLRIN